MKRERSLKTEEDDGQNKLQVRLMLCGLVRGRETGTEAGARSEKARSESLKQVRCESGKKNKISEESRTYPRQGERVSGSQQREGEGVSRSGMRDRKIRRAGATGNFMVKLLRACVGMPRHRKAMKDVANCEKLRGAVSTL